MMKTRLLAAVAAFLLSAGVARASAPLLFTYNGFLQDTSGNPATPGAQSLTFTFYAAPTGGVALGTYTTGVTTGTDGYFSVVVDTSGFSAVFTNQTYMSVKLNAGSAASSGGEIEMTPRIQLTSVPSSLTVPYSGITNFPVAQCGAGQFVTGYDLNGNFICGTPPSTGVTSAVAGSGIQVSGATGAVTFSVAYGGNGAATTAARSDHNHDAAYPSITALSASGTLNNAGNPVDWTKLKNVPAGLADGDNGIVGITFNAPITGSVSGTGEGATATVGLQSCAPGQILKIVGGAWACTADDATTVSAASGGGLTVGGTALAPTVGLQTCTANQILKWNGSAWACATDSVNAGTVTVVSAVAPLFVTNGSSTPQLTIQPATDAQPGYLTSVDHAAFAAKQNRVTGTCGPGMFATGVNSDGSLQCTAELNGTVTSVATGAGLTGGPITTSGTISLADGGVTAAKLAAGAVGFGAWSTNGCTNGQIPKFNGAAWACAADVDTTYTAGAGLALSGGAFSLNSSGCLNGYVLKWNGAAWQCQQDSDTTYTAGSGLALTGNVFSLSTACSAGQILKWNGAAWQCQADQNAGGTVTVVTGSLPLVVTNGATTTPNLSINQATALSPGFLTSTDWVTFNTKQEPLQATCAPGTYLQGFSAAGVATCIADANAGGTVTSVTGGTGIGINGNANLNPVVFIANGGVGSTQLAAGAVGATHIASRVVDFSHWASNACTNGQVPKFNGANWVCAADNDTTYTAGSGLTLVGSQFSIPGGGIGTGHIASGAITSALMAASSVGSAALQSGAVTATHLSAGSVGTAALALGAVGTSQLATGAVTSATIADGTIAFADMAQNGCATGQVPRWNGAAWSCAYPINSVTGISPVVVTTTSNSAQVAIQQATTSTNGFVTSTDWNTFNNKQARVTGTCASGQSIDVINADGTVSCTNTQLNGTSWGAVMDPTTVDTQLAPIVGVAITSGQKVHWTSSGAWGSTIAGGGVGLQIYPCYRLAGGAWTLLGGNIGGLTVPQSQRHIFSISAAVQLFTTGTVQFSMCGSSTTPASWNWKDWGYTSVLVVN